MQRAYWIIIGVVLTIAPVFATDSSIPPTAQLDQLLAGFKQDVLGTFSQECSGDINGPLTCTTTAGDAKLIQRKGILVDSAGNTIVNDNVAIQRVIEGQDDTHPSLVSFASIDPSANSCSITAASGQRVTKGISAVAFNPVLNVLYVTIVTTRQDYTNIVLAQGASVPSITYDCAATASNPFVLGGISGATGQTVARSTATLIKVSGPFKGINVVRPRGGF